MTISTGQMIQNPTSTIVSSSTSSYSEDIVLSDSSLADGVYINTIKNPILLVLYGETTEDITLELYRVMFVDIKIQEKTNEPCSFPTSTNTKGAKGEAKICSFVMGKCENIKIITLPGIYRLYDKFGTIAASDGQFFVTATPLDKSDIELYKSYTIVGNPPNTIVGNPPNTIVGNPQSAVGR